MMGNVTYLFSTEAEPVTTVIDGKAETVRIYHYQWNCPQNRSVETIFCKHPLFGQRISKDEDLYPDDSKDLSFFLRFFSLWNQTVAALSIRHEEEIDVLSVLDYHTALAPMYIQK